jgi:hypothetical protein
MLVSLGRYDEALAAARRAAAIDPRSPNVRTIVAVRFWALERWDEARAEFERAFALDPTFPLTLMHASWFYWTRGDTAAFFSVRERLDAVAEQGGVPAHLLRAAYSAGGPDSVLRLQLAAPGARYNPAERVKARVLLGDLDGAFADLQQAERERSVWLAWLTRYAFMAPLRNDPRYESFFAADGNVRDAASRQDHPSMIANRLAAMPLFESVARTELEWLAAHGEVRTYVSGTLVRRVGSPIEEMSILLSGRVALHWSGPAMPVDTGLNLLGLAVLDPRDQTG